MGLFKDRSLTLPVPGCAPVCVRDAVCGDFPEPDKLQLLCELSEFTEVGSPSLDTCDQVGIFVPDADNEEVEIAVPDAKSDDVLGALDLARTLEVRAFDLLARSRVLACSEATSEEALALAYRAARVYSKGLASARQARKKLGYKSGLVQGLRLASRDAYRFALVLSLRLCGRELEADRVNVCGEQYKVMKCLDCGSTPAFPVSCDHRLCVRCSAKRAQILITEHEEILKQIRYPRMMTLTFLSVKSLDREYIAWSRNCFSKLRHRKIMSSCRGGIYSFEVTYSSLHGWHLHVHALIDSDYIPQDKLSEVWRDITGGACVVDIRAIKGSDKWNAIREVIKYPSKVATFVWNPALVDEFLNATKGVSLAYGFGSLYKVRSVKSSGSPQCPVCGGENLTIEGGFGFYVWGGAIKRVKGGYLWHPPPDKGLVSL